MQKTEPLALFLLEGETAFPQNDVSPKREAGACELGDDFQYGGQAVIEGVMMRGRTTMAVAVRSKDNGIAVRKQGLSQLSSRWPVLKWPIIRGAFALVESLIIGFQALFFSANEFAGEEKGEKLTPWELAVSMALAAVVFVGLFIVLPNVVAVTLGRSIKQVVLLNVAEGTFRIFVFLGYIVAISSLKDIRRVFEYHGAEHKVIHAYEAGEELTVDNARRYTTLHPRCGTNFLLIVMVIMVLLFSLLGRRTLIVRIVSRLLLLPVVAGLSYEVIKAAGKKKVPRWLRWVSAPGLWLQKLTTREPDDSQLEVAIIALKEVIESDRARV